MIVFCFFLHGEFPTKFGLSSHNKISKSKVGISSPEQNLMTSPWEILLRQKHLFFISFCFTNESWRLIEVAFNDLSDGFIWFRRWVLINFWHYRPRAHLEDGAATFFAPNSVAAYSQQILTSTLKSKKKKQAGQVYFVPVRVSDKFLSITPIKSERIKKTKKKNRLKKEESII